MSERLFDPGPPTRRESFFHSSRDEKQWDEFSSGIVHAGTRQSALDRAGIGELTHPMPGTAVVHELAVRPDATLNTPETAVSDRHANKALHAEDAYMPPDGLRSLNENDKKFPKYDIEDAYLDEGKGVYYENAVEDRGSISVATTPEKYDFRATHKVTSPTVEMEGPNQTDYRFANPVDLGTPSVLSGHRYSIKHRRVTQDRLFEVGPGKITDSEGNVGTGWPRRYLGSPQWDRIR